MRGDNMSPVSQDCPKGQRDRTHRPFRDVSVPLSRSLVVGRESEADLLQLVTDAADVLGSEWLHLRPGRTAHGWRTPVSGSLGVGWPDLVLIHRSRVRGSRLLAAELKSDAGRVSPDQARVLAVLAAAGIECHVVRPSTVDAFLEVLR